MPQPSAPTLAERGVAWGLQAVNTLASSELLDRLGIRETAEKILFTGSKRSVRAAGAAGRAFKASTKLAGPQRQGRPARTRELFDLTPTREQRLMADSVRDFALEFVRPAARQADRDLSAPVELYAQANELGLAAVGVPESLGGMFEERSAVTSVLLAEAFAQGDLGFAVGVLAPAGVATALSLWGDADQQATYLPEFVGENPPAAAVAVTEPRPLFDPFALSTTATRTADGYVLNGVKSLVPRAAEDELFIIAADLDGAGPALFIVESRTPGLSTEAEPAMGLRAAATGRVILDGVTVPPSALLGDGDPDVYRELIALGRLGWAALAMGTGRAVLDYVTPYVNDRVAFGEPISNRQAVAFKVADIAIELDGLRLVTLRAAALIDAGKDYTKQVALARTLATKYGMQIGSDGVQLLGGHGFTKEHPVERWYRDLRATGLIEGVLVP
ncbi:MAG TPA: acyl-CoA dehydrogenase family protein [Solirubrobacteraceae bacterium]|nr:acyl-CoA dehydrogenase family protein [Solirubrobacteraceae bacterium]